MQFSADGRILHLIPHFDSTRPTFAMLTPEIKEKTIKQLIFYCNKTVKLRDPKRAQKIVKKMSLWIMFQYNLSRTGQQELRLFVNRIMNGTFIQFDVITDDPQGIPA